MTRLDYKRSVFIAVAIGITTLHSASQALGDEPPASNTAGDTPTKVLVLHPAQEPTPALKYQLLPTVLQRKPGNAAVIYNQMIGYFDDQSADEDLNSLIEWIASPTGEFPRDKARSVVDGSGYQMRQIRRASRMEHCDWQLPLGEEESFSIHLPELQAMRAAARLLAIEARLQIAEGQIDAALQTIQTGYALARHTGEGPTLVSHLVGIAISDVMTDQLVALIQHPDAPNLYWAIASMGDHWMDPRRGIEMERFSLDLTYDWWNDLYATDQSAEVWRDRFNEFVRGVGQWGDSSAPWPSDWGATIVGIQGYPRAKQYLIDQGRTEADVEKMPVAQVLLIYTVETYRELRDDVLRWMYLPYWQVRQQMQDAGRQMDEASTDREIVPLARLLVPGVSGFSLALARHQRSLAVLRVVEAVRLYGASHDGQLPEQLGDITQVPLPTDPLTGKAFVYHVADGTAILQSPPPAESNRWNRDMFLRYEIRFAP